MTSKYKIGLIKEGKIPQDSRVAFAPSQALSIKNQYSVEIVCQKSEIRCFADQEYAQLGIPVVDDVGDCDILFGIKEVPLNQLIENKTYLFFSHTIKAQPYNRNLLKTILDKKIRLIDYEVLKEAKGKRVVAFGRYAGIVGAYNAILTFGLKSNLFSLKRAKDCFDYQELKQEYKKVKLPPSKILVTGTGRVGQGATEVLDGMGISRIWPKDFVNKKYDHPVYTQLFSRDYYTRKDGKQFDIYDLYKNPQLFKSYFERYLPYMDIMIAGAYWDPRAPVLFTRDQIVQDDNRPQVIADITCDIEGSIPSTKKASTIAEPFYDYNAETDSIAPPFSDPVHTTVMAVDNLPSELPRDASTDFGAALLQYVLPNLLQKDDEGMIAKATIAENGQLTEHFKYLTDYVSD